jgi:hypothetical protein
VSNATVFKTATAPIRLTFREIFVRGEGGKLFCCFQSKIGNPISKIELAGALRFELKTSVLETGVLPIETTRLCKYWSERRESNPQQTVWKTATQPFEFRSQILVHRERFELSQLRNERQFYRLLALNQRRPMREK